MPYAELLARTSLSLLEGASHPDEMVARAVEAGVSHLGVVDRDAVYGVVQCHEAAKAAGLPLILGATITVEEHPPVALLVESAAGWASLCRLLTSARQPEVKGFARSSVRRVAEACDGLTAVLKYGWTPDAAAPLAEAFRGRLVLAASRSLAPADRVRTAWAEAVGGALAVPVIASNDPLYALPRRQRVADVLSCIRRRTTLSASGRAVAANAERHLLDEPAFRERFRDRPAWVDAASEVASRCAFSLDQIQYLYPREVVPDGWTPMTWLTWLVDEGLVERYGPDVPATVRAQVAHELSVIEDMQFPAYFLTVYDAVRFARERGILCQGRGSAANSAVCYALGITAVDPSRSSLLFERFLSKERGEPPDIDVDFEHERREEVLQYVYDRYGRDRAGMINEVISWRRRSAVREVGKVMGLGLDQVDRLARSVDRWSAGAEAKVEDLIREAGVDPNDRAVRLTLDLAEELEGFPRHLSIHVGGFTISDGPLIDLVPIEPAAMADRTVLQWDKYDVDALNLVKVDLLSLGMLTAIRKAFDLVRGFDGTALGLASIPAEDPGVYDMFCAADTIGVFQIESRAQQSMLPRLRPRCFYDLVIEVAIVRPGPIQGGMVHPYLRRRKGDDPVTYAHPALEPILERTLGVPLFQEQVMAMAVAVGGFSPGEADQLRRAMGAWRKRGKLDVLGRRLVAGMIERGIAPAYAEAVFQQILGFGEYGFPESHAASFALLVYVSGWLKRYHPAAFAAALVNSQPMGFYSPRALLDDAARHGVALAPPCVVVSGWDCALEPDAAGRPAIRVGLRLVRGLPEAAVERLIAARAQRPFADLADLVHRADLSRGEARALAESGAFAKLEPDRRKATWIIHGLWSGSLFAGLGRPDDHPDLPAESAWDGLTTDYRATGMSLRAHPMALVRPGLREPGVSTVMEVKERVGGDAVRIVGMVMNRQRPGTANGVVFMTLEDETGLINLIIWPKTWARDRLIARNDSFLGIDGHLQREDGAVSVLVDRFFAVDAARALAVPSRDFH